MMVAPPKNWVDYVSNLMTMDWPCDSAEVAMEVRLPDDRLRTFLHEHTHFTSWGYSVGRALATIYQIIVETTYGPDILARLELNGRDDPLIRLLQNFRAAVIFFEGLAEGLALFAEWDALPGPSPAASSTMTTALKLYYDWQSHKTEPWGILKSALQDARTGPDAEQDKTNLLTQPIAGPQGHYLLGYLCIKALHIEALKRSARLWDTDLFVHFVTWAVFNDPFVAAHVYAIDQPFGEWLDKLQGLSTASLLGVLRSDDLDLRVQRFEEHVSDQAKAPDERVQELASVLGIRVSDAELPLRHAERAARIATENAGASTRRFSDRQFEAVITAFSRARGMLRIRLLQADAVAVSGKLLFQESDGKTIAECSVEDDVADGMYPNSTYSLYYLPTHWSFLRVAICHQDPWNLLGWQRLAHGPADGLPDVDQARSYAFSACVVERREFNNDKGGGPRAAMEAADASLAPHERQAAIESRLKLAACCLWGMVDPGQHYDRLGLLNSLGLCGWLGKERRIIDAAVRVSLAASRDPDLAFIERAMAGCDPTLAELLAYVERAENALELNLLHASFSSESAPCVAFGF